MDDRKLNPLRLALLVSIALYFASVGLRLPTKNPSETIPQATQAPLVQPQVRIDGCHAHISEATASTRELRLKVSGTAETLRVSYDGGMIVKATEEVCSGGECRVFTPAAPKNIQLDGCPAITLP